MPITIDYEKCCWKDGKYTKSDCEEECSRCLEICPVQALTRNNKIEVDNTKCIDCGSCIAVCKYQAISFN